MSEELHHNSSQKIPANHKHTRFSFGRSVVSRFVSAAAEVARRFQLLGAIGAHLGQAALNRTIQAIENDDADELALMILKEVLRRNWDMKYSPIASPDAWNHLDPQAVFLTHTPPDYDPVHAPPELAYMGRVESLEDDFRTVTTPFFGEFIVHSMPIWHEHDGNSDAYTAERAAAISRSGESEDAADIVYQDRILQILNSSTAEELS